MALDEAQGLGDAALAVAASAQGGAGVAWQSSAAEDFDAGLAVAGAARQGFAAEEGHSGEDLQIPTGKSI